jgi:hypothetical protein
VAPARTPARPPTPDGCGALRGGCPRGAPTPAAAGARTWRPPLIALVAGILILVRPRLLNYIVAIYLIAIGVLGLLGGSGMRLG